MDPAWFSSGSSQQFARGTTWGVKPHFYHTEHHTFGHTLYQAPSEIQAKATTMTMQQFRATCILTAMETIKANMASMDGIEPVRGYLECPLEWNSGVKNLKKKTKNHHPMDLQSSSLPPDHLWYALPNRRRASTIESVCVCVWENTRSSNGHQTYIIQTREPSINFQPENNNRMA